MKRCSACRRDLPTSEFYADARARDGRQSACRACHVARIARSGNRRATHAKATLRYQRRFPERHVAMQRVYRAIKSGRLIRPPECSHCGAVGPVQGHHADYSKPLEVVWLCVGCHANERTPA